MLPRFLARPTRLLLTLGLLGGAWGAAARTLPSPGSRRTLAASEGQARAPVASGGPSASVAGLPQAELSFALAPAPGVQAAVPGSSGATAGLAPGAGQQPARLVEVLPGPAAPASSVLAALVEGSDRGGPVGEATPLESEQIGRLLGAAHRQLYGVYPGPERWLVAWAHVSHEISRGATCVENNLGNAVISRRWRGGWHLRQVRERNHRGEERWVVQRVRFRSYDTPMDGAVDYWRIITGNFGSSLPYFDTGDAREAGRVLCERGYSTASCEAYGAGLRGLYAELRARHGGPSIRLMQGWEPAPLRAEDWPDTRSDVSQIACDSGCF